MKELVDTIAVSLVSVRPVVPPPMTLQRRRQLCVLAYQVTSYANRLEVEAIVFGFTATSSARYNRAIRIANRISRRLLGEE